MTTATPAVQRPPTSGGGGRQFASDNYAGICPEAWDALQRANAGHAVPYGEDTWTQKAADLLRELFECDAEVFFCFNGTAANAMSVAHLCQSYHSIICHELAHLETDECGGPEFFSNGTKLLLAPCSPGSGGDNGLLTPDGVEAIVRKRTDIHYPKPRVISLTQPTEVGTVYGVDQLAALGDVARRHGLKFHMDGARFANAVASLNVSPRQITRDVGVDVLCFGGTKNGLPVGEAVIFFDRKLAREFDYRCKQAGQLASKMRFITAPWVGVLENGAWLRNGRHGNAMAQRLRRAVENIPGVRILFPTQANSVFVDLPPAVVTRLREEGHRFYTFIGAGGARFMCAWDTQADDVDRLAAAIKAAVGA